MSLGDCLWGDIVGLFAGLLVLVVSLAVTVWPVFVVLPSRLLPAGTSRRVVSGFLLAACVAGSVAYYRSFPRQYIVNHEWDAPGELEHAQRCGGGISTPELEGRALQTVDAEADISWFVFLNVRSIASLDNWLRYEVILPKCAGNRELSMGELAGALCYVASLPEQLVFVLIYGIALVILLIPLCFVSPFVPAGAVALWILLSEN